MLTVRTIQTGDTVQSLMVALKTVKGYVLRDAKQVLASEQSAGRFPKDPKDYSFFFRGDSGRMTRRRSVDDINPDWILLSPKGSTFEFQAKGFDAQAMVDAANMAMSILLRRSPRGATGRYIGMMRPAIDGAFVRPSGVTKDRLNDKSIITITAGTEYSGRIEAAYYTSVYRKSPQAIGGIFYPAAKETAGAFAGKVNVSLRFVPIGNYLGPEIVITPIGESAASISEPGRNIRRILKRMRSRRRRSR